MSSPVLPFKCKYRITARYSSFDEKISFTSLAMFDIRYLANKWPYKCVVLYTGIVHVLKQCVKIVDVSVDWRCHRLVIYWLALVVLDLCSGQCSKCKNEQRAISPKLGNAEWCFLCTVLLHNEIYLPSKSIVDTSCSLNDVLDKMWSDGQTSEWTKRQRFIHIAVPSESINTLLFILPIKGSISRESRWYGTWSLTLIDLQK